MSGEDGVLGLGGLAERGGAGMREKLAGLGAGDHPRFFRVCEAFSLEEGERCAFAWCLWRADRLLPYPSAPELAALCRGSGVQRRGLPLLLDPRAGGVLRLACDLFFDEPPRLPDGLWTAQAAEPCFHDPALPALLCRFLDSCAPPDASLPAAAALSGARGTGRKYLFAQLCRERGCALLCADCAALTAGRLPELAGTALLLDALICLDGYEPRFESLVQGLYQWFSVVLLCCREEVPAPASCLAMLARRVPPLTGEGRLRAMRALFGKEVPARALDLSQAPVGALGRAAARVRAERAADPGQDPEEILLRALRSENAPSLTKNAQLLSSPALLRDLVLPQEQKRQLSEMCGCARSRRRVWKEWGFERKLGGSPGLTALFYGASGTGKTMAASAVSNELGLPLYRVDLSQMISKYIGETQKNIGCVFDDAAGADCILFFDEADALFSRRLDTADAQDRYANAEVAYLLQRTEQHDGIILLATNLLQNFDEAFRRRIGFMIRFPAPDEGRREELWRAAFPAQASVGKLDFPLLACQLELTGASIRSCALSAAMAAAANRGIVEMRGIVAAARREYQKLGKPFPELLDQRYPTERSRT